MTENELLGIVIERLKDINTELVEHGKILVLQEANLKEHMRRTEAAERSIDVLKNATEKSVDSLVVAIKPLQDHVSGFQTFLKICGAVAALSGFILVIIEIYSKLF